MAELSESTRFLRGELASDAGIRRGLALPCTTRGHASYVLSLLSGSDTPVVLRAERWLVDAGIQRFLLAGGYCEQQGALPAQGPVLDFGGLQDGLFATLMAGKPALLSGLAQAHGDAGAAARSCGANSAVCLPTPVDGKTKKGAVLYLWNPNDGVSRH